MKYLNLIRYHDPNTGEKKELKILDDLSADWECIGEILGFRPQEINAIRHAGAGKTLMQCLREVISKWIQNADNMPSSKRYPCNWNGLYNMLMDSKHGATANDLKAAITASSSDLHQSFDDVHSTPSLSISNLTCLRWTDKGQAQILKIREKISPRWEEAGDLLGLTTERLKVIDMHRRGDVGMCCHDVLVDWLHENQGGYSATWEGVVQLLEDMDLSAAAQQLKNALHSVSNIKQTNFTTNNLLITRTLSRYYVYSLIVLVVSFICYIYFMYFL